MFKYKFDKQKYFIKYKTKLCVKKNLQHIEQNTFVVTLTIKIFKALMTIVAALDLKIKQYDTINAFINSEIDEFIYCYTFDE